jgi:hypothetical protein
VHDTGKRKGVNLRLAAAIALALVCFGCASATPPGPTWEFYLPPPKQGPIVGYDYQAPVSSWRRANDRAYVSLDECLCAKSDMIKAWSGEARASAHSDTSSFGIQIDRLRSGQCLASNDPRLRVE